MSLYSPPIRVEADGVERLLERLVAAVDSIVAAGWLLRCSVLAGTALAAGLIAVAAA
jgi:hypothetical protein